MHETISTKMKTTTKIRNPCYLQNLILTYFIIHKTWNLTKSEKVLEEKCGNLIQVKLCNDEVPKKTNNEKYVKQIADYFRRGRVETGL